METCRKNYPTGPAAHLLNVMETEHQTYLDQQQGCKIIVLGMSYGLTNGFTQEKPLTGLQ